MPSPARDAASYRMTVAQADWLRLAAPDGSLPRDWPSPQAGRSGGRRVNIRIIFSCLRQGWVRPSPQLAITEEGQAALAAYRGSQRLAAQPGESTVGGDGRLAR